ncbi:hypothetical protein BW686_15805 [Pseudomonas syringae]|uniref:Uncharacterized protein n=1 Tax=Pseudomonas syringae TaxID=317 RepID=A0A244EPU3_PSESX|nr:hypothetical protein [Pseudomonas syringae]OUM06555.1 hypothetical protein BW686_15805 [Pseudomonas syringae]
MIIEKVFDAFYEEASRFITKWRISVFFASWAFVSKTIEVILKFDFWTGSLADGGAALLSSLTSIAFYKLVLLAITAFYIGPLLANKAAYLLLKWRMRHADKLFEAVDSAIASIRIEILATQLAKARDEAVLAEKQIERRKAINEFYITLILIYGSIFFSAMYSVEIIGISLVAWIVLVYILVQKMLIIYVSKIHYFKLLAAKASSEMISSPGKNPN